MLPPPWGHLDHGLRATRPLWVRLGALPRALPCPGPPALAASRVSWCLSGVCSPELPGPARWEAPLPAKGRKRECILSSGGDVLTRRNTPWALSLHRLWGRQHRLTGVKVLTRRAWVRFAECPDGPRLLTPSYASEQEHCHGLRTKWQTVHACEHISPLWAEMEKSMLATSSWMSPAREAALTALSENHLPRRGWSCCLFGLLLA